jgi:hypothetical protein
VHFESDGKDFPKKTVIHNNAAFIARSVLPQMSWHVKLEKKQKLNFFFFLNRRKEMTCQLLKNNKMRRDNWFQGTVRNHVFLTLQLQCIKPN